MRSEGTNRRGGHFFREVDNTRNTTMKTMRLIVFCMILCCLFGCRKRYPDGMPRLYPCRVTVLGEGKPVEGAIVMLIPESLETQNLIWTPMATTDPNGLAVFYTNARYGGAPLGEYRIVVIKSIAERNESLPPAPPVDTPEYLVWSDKVGDILMIYYDIVDPTFGDPDKTPLEMEVVKAKMNEKEIDVGAPVRVRRK